MVADADVAAKDVAVKGADRAIARSLSLASPRPRTARRTPEETTRLRTRMVRVSSNRIRAARPWDLTAKFAAGAGVAAAAAAAIGKAATARRHSKIMERYAVKHADGIPCREERIARRLSDERYYPVSLTPLDERPAPAPAPARPHRWRQRRKKRRAAARPFASRRRFSGASASTFALADFAAADAGDLLDGKRGQGHSPNAAGGPRNCSATRDEQPR